MRLPLDTALDTGLDIDTGRDRENASLFRLMVSSSSSPSRLITREKRLCRTTLPQRGSTWLLGGKASLTLLLRSTLGSISTMGSTFFHR